MEWEIVGGDRDKIEEILKEIVITGNKEVQDAVRKYKKSPVLSTMLSGLMFAYREENDKFILSVSTPFKKIPKPVLLFFNPDKKLKKIFKESKIKATVKQIK